MIKGNRGGGFGRGGHRGIGGGRSVHQSEIVCVCPRCGYEQPHQMGEPCNMKKCEKCGTLMIRS